MGEEAGNKSEEPTPHKLQEARKKGQVTHSKEITTAILVLFTYKLFANQAEQIWYSLVGFGSTMFRQMSPVVDSLNIGIAGSYVAYGISTILTTLLPLILPVAFVAVVVSLLQTQFLFSAESMKPKLEKLDPIKGVKRIFSLKGLVQVLITIVKIILVALITFNIIKGHLSEIISSMTMSSFAMMLLVGSLVMEIATKVGMFYLVIAMLDYFYQKYEFNKSMMMTKQEIKEEYKRLEGDPTIKQAQKQKQREMAMQRQRGAVPGADVVVTNPTHIACAIRYKPEIDKAPILVAKGKRLFAQEIKDLAEEHYVPIVENVALARGIFDSTDIGDEVPPELYRAVAEVLAFVYKLGRNKTKEYDKPVVDQNS